MARRLVNAALVRNTLLAALLYIARKLWKRKHPPLPPGPPPLPFIGNVHQVPLVHSHVTFAEWGKRYGPIFHLSILGKSIVILSTAQAASDLLEKRGAIYANRPRLVMAGEIAGYEGAMTLAPYDSTHRERRRLIYESFSSRKLSRYHEFGERRARKLMAHLLKEPANFQRHIAGYVAATVFNATHGHEVTGHDDPFVSLAEQCGVEFCEMVRPGAFLVDVLPFLKYVPEWLPFAGFMRKAKLYRDTADRMRDIPYDFVREQMAIGAAKPSFTTDILDTKPDRTPEEDFSYRWLTATIYTAGADTSSSILNSFVLAMTLNPEVQMKAQYELDNVLGPNRLPTFADRDSLPYTKALCLELLRLYCPTPTGELTAPCNPYNVSAPRLIFRVPGLPHLAIQDDEYLGYRIPAGATVIANNWWILRDPSNYFEPEKFIPERFLSCSAESPSISTRTVVFGYGRRVCPGSQFAEDMIFIAVATILSLYDLKPAASGPPSGEFTSNLTIHPKPFECSIKPRSPAAEKIIKEVEDS